MKKALYFCFFFPFISNALNAVGWLNNFMGPSLTRLVAYGNLFLLMVGFVLLIKSKRNYSPIAKKWFVFFFIYYMLATLGSLIYENPFDVLKTLVSVVYCVGFASFLRFEKFNNLFAKVATVVFSIANILLIVLFKLKIDLDKVQQLSIFTIDRAQGVYGDANNAALVGILGFIFLHQFFKPRSLWLKLLKIALILMTVYGITLTLSTTGIATFIMVFFVLNSQYITKQYILIGLIVGPLMYLSILNLDKVVPLDELNIRQRKKVENVINLMSFNFDEVDNSGRTELVSNTMEYIYDNPVLGRGLGFGQALRSHNTFLNIWVDSGIIGLLVLIYLFLVYLKNIIRSPKNIRYFSISIYLTVILFMLSLQTVINQAYIVCVLLYVAYITDFNKSTSKLPKIRSIPSSLEARGNQKPTIS